MMMDGRSSDNDNNGDGDFGQAPTVMVMMILVRHRRRRWWWFWSDLHVLNVCIALEFDREKAAFLPIHL